MTESSIYIVSPIIISALALIVSILSYVESSKSVKISEEEHKLTIEKEDRKANLSTLLETLNDTSKTLKKLPDYLTFASLDFLMSDIMQEVYENKKLELSIKFKYLDVNGQKVSLESIDSEKFLKDEIRVFLNHEKEQRIISLPILYYETLPELPYSERFELIDIFSALSDLEQDLDDLKEFELFINSYDSEFLGTINNEYNEILKLIYKTLNEKTFRFEFNSTMKPSDIERNLCESFNLTKMKNKSEFMATKLKSRVDEISKELTMRILTQ